MIALIATTKDGGMGTDHGLPWRCPVDLQDFLRTTIGQTVIVGRKTFETIPNRLVGRRVVVLSRTPIDETDTDLDHVDYCDSVEEALVHVRMMHKEALSLGHPQGQVFVIGGREIYDQFLPVIREVRHTVIPAQYVTDKPTVHIDITTMLPDTQWTVVERSLLMGRVGKNDAFSTNFVYKSIYKKFSE